MNDLTVFITDAARMLTWETTLQRCISLRVEATEQRNLATKLEEEANTLMSAFSKATGINEVKSNIGTLLYIPTGKSSSFKKDIFKKFLIAKGVAADLIQEGFEKATKESQKKEQVRWTPIKEKKE